MTLDNHLESHQSSDLAGPRRLRSYLAHADRRVVILFILCVIGEPRLGARWWYCTPWLAELALSPTLGCVLKVLPLSDSERETDGDDDCLTFAPGGLSCCVHECEQIFWIEEQLTSEVNLRDMAGRSLAPRARWLSTSSIYAFPRRGRRRDETTILPSGDRRTACSDP